MHTASDEYAHSDTHTQQCTTSQAHPVRQTKVRHAHSEANFLFHKSRSNEPELDPHFPQLPFIAMSFLSLHLYQCVFQVPCRGTQCDHIEPFELVRYFRSLVRTRVVARERRVCTSGIMCTIRRAQCALCVTELRHSNKLQFVSH